MTNINMPTFAKKSFIQECIDNLMHFRDYSADMHPHPVELEYTQLHLFGSRHSTNPEDTMFDDIEDRLTKFLKLHGVENTTVIIEGGLGDSYTDRNQAKQNGEMAFTRFIAERAGVTAIESPEPTEHELVRAIESYGFTLDEYIFRQFLSAIYYKLDTVGKSITVKNLVDFYKYLYSIFKYDWIDISEELDETKLDDGASSNIIQSQLIKTLMSWMDKFGIVIKLPTKITPDAILEFNKDQLEEEVSPRDPDLPNTKYLPKMSGLLNKIRDQKVLERILQLTEENRSVFVIFGASHVYMWKPVFEKYFGAEGR